MKHGLKAARSLDRSAGAGLLLGNRGALYYALGDRHCANLFGAGLEQELAIQEGARDRIEHMGTLHNLNMVPATRGHPDQALGYYQHALAIQENEDACTRLAATLTIIGLVHAGRGERQQGVEYFAQARALGDVIGDRTGHAAVLHNIEGTYDALDDR